MKRLGMGLIVLFFLVDMVNAQTLPTMHKNLEIKMGNKIIGKIENIRINKNNDESRVSVQVDAKIESFVKHLDEILRKKRNLGNCIERIYWRGKSKIKKGGKSLKLSSRIAYELWVCPGIKKLRTRVIRDTRRVHWTLSIYQPQRIERIKLRAKVKNIVGWPNWVERLFGLRVTKKIPIKLPKSCGSCNCSELVGSVSPKIESLQFAKENGGSLRVSAFLSTNRNIIDIIKCLS